MFLRCVPNEVPSFFAATVDVFDGSQVRRWLLPCLAVGPNFMDTLGKTMSLLWQIFLIAGPRFDHIRSFLWRVRSITTDMGVERNIVDIRDVLKEFFWLVDHTFDVSAYSDEEWLWPNAWQIPGWKHAWDLLLQKALNCLAWFPLWLKRFKAIVGFMRVEAYMTTLLRSLRNSGLAFLADLLKATSFPSFADWRWGTLHACIRAVRPLLDSLIEHFDPTPFLRGRESSQACH